MESLPKTLPPLAFAIIAMAMVFPAAAANHRSQAARHASVNITPCPATGEAKLPCPGYIIDHVKPLCAEGADTQSSQVTPPNSSTLLLSHVFVGFWSGLARL